MAENENGSQGVSVEEHQKLQADFQALSENFKSQGEKLSKLEGIFNERQTKVLDKEGILKILGIEKAPEKPIGEVLNEKFTILSDTIQKLEADIKSKDEKIALNEKKAQVTELAKKYNFIDVGDVLGVIDFNNANFDEQLKALAESKKHWVQAADYGKSFAGAKQKGNDKDDPFLQGFSS